MKKYVIWLVIFAILEISLALYLTHWRENFWNAVTAKEQLHFVQQLGVFSVVALFICFVSGISGYIVSLTAIKWREHLNNKAFAIRELEIGDTKCPHLLTSSDKMYQIENLPQRIQEDCRDYPDLFLNLGFGTVKSICYIIVFSISLIMSFSWIYLTILVIYCILGTIVTHFIAKPLITLNYQSQRIEATYRSNLTLNNFNDCIIIMLGLAKKQKHLTYFQQFYSQLGVVIPLIIIAPLYFSSGMTVGALMRFNSLSSTILDSLSYGINSFSIINRLISCKRRLKEAGII